MNSDDLDDPDLRAAIAASLRDSCNHEESSHNGQQLEVVDLTADSDDDVIPLFPKSNSVIGSETDGDETDSGEEDDDDEDEDLKKAIELSMQGAIEDENGPSRHHLPSADNNDSKASNTPLSSRAEAPESTQALTQTAGLLGLDRRQMETDRLARLNKRKAEESVSDDQRDAKHARTGTPPRSSGPVISVVDTLSGSNSSRTTPAGDDQQIQIPSPIPSVQFPNGIVKKTWAFGCRRQGDDIKIEEVLQKSDLQLAVLSSFMWEMEWLFSKLNTAKTRFYLVMQAKDESTKLQYQSETAAMSNLRLCFPPMDGQVNCMHSKLMLLFHSGYVRIVVPTANLTPYDWGEIGGLMENSVFIMDLPKRSDKDSELPRTAFYDELTYFLKASTLHENIIAKLTDYDFSKTTNIAFVHTIGGSHMGDSWRRTGYCGLGRAVDSLGLRTSKPLNVDFVASSVGSLTDEFLRSIYLACQGDDGSTEYVLRTAKSFPARSRNNPTQLIDKSTAEEWKDRFRVYFPSETTVNDTKGGPQSAGTICFQSKWYTGPKFPRQVLRDCVSQRPGLLMHNKILYVRPDDPATLPDNSQCRAWAYVGSANLSESAWGRLVQERATKEPKLNCRNWECGVLIPVLNREDAVSEQNKSPNDESGTMLDIFERVVPVPMRLPAPQYGPNRRPWFNSESGM
ncbi:putative tyrosyl-DNA phosphodiesterase [Aspergillus bombycis]|uniref:Putative tyrosyl-DNA phosphodiesterase n=1 Tax=Aspergillus bombycis TaxID=109264 RepID=A0A1F8AF85_9EURO|nr:putative tyrosyl-DNA phosphodiesterase [Aspergillus bombycis]OGM50341.1 putative tyrosyl-DNA phosphodiesterase [Aspergillus bombycis]